jgi:hypothetical protein
MRPATLALILALTFTANAQQQTWHIDEATLPIPLDSLPQQQQANIRRALEPRIEYHLDDGDPSDLDQAELAKAQRNLYVLFLKRSSGTLTFVSGWTYLMCGAVGNCMTWVLDQQNKILLEDSGKAITVLGRIHHTRPDILFSVHDSASDTDLERWRFNGSKYVLSWCGTSTTGSLGHYRKHPYTYSYPCQSQTPASPPPPASPIQSTHP